MGCPLSIILALQTTIECLLEQNAQLRNNMKTTATSVVSAVGAPAQVWNLLNTGVELCQLQLQSNCTYSYLAILRSNQDYQLLILRNWHNNRAVPTTTTK